MDLSEYLSGFSERCFYSGSVLYSFAFPENLRESTTDFKHTLFTRMFTYSLSRKGEENSKEEF